MSRGLVAALAALALAGCGARAQTGTYPFAVEASATPLNPGDLQQSRVGVLDWAGGLVLKAKGTDGFGGVSGLDVEADGRFIAVTDAGDLIRGRVVLDPRGRLAGVAETTIARLTDEQGRPYDGKSAGDAEDVTLLPGGGYAVSFEQDHRVIVYGAGGQARRLEPPPGARLEPNTGLEALAAWRDPATGQARLVMGTEFGDAYACGMDGGDCRQILSAERDNPHGFRLTGLDALPDGRLVALYRAASLFGGLRAIVAEVRPGADTPLRPLAQLAGGLTVDNMEALAAVTEADGRIRLYLASDDNFSSWQRTLLLAFDWRP